MIFSRSAKIVLCWEITVLSEERIAASHEYKYNSLHAEIQAKGWRHYNIMLQLKLGYAVWGVVAKSLERAARRKWSKVDS